MKKPIIRDLPKAHQRRFIKWLMRENPSMSYDFNSEYNPDDYQKFKAGK